MSNARCLAVFDICHIFIIIYVKMELNRTNEDVMDIFSDKKLIKVCAPMVRYSKLQFRNLVRKYNCDLCFTPMILADSFCLSEKARNNEFSTNLNDTPLIIQFAANTVHDFVGAAYNASPYCNGVDLNCGCPQRWAKAQGIGCVMLEKPENIYDLVRQCRNHISKPFSISVKMRILPDLKKSVSICQQLEKCGVSFLTVHGRIASQHSVGDVNVDALRLLSDSVQCPVIANGGVKNLDDVLDLHEKTKCKGVMVANGLLTNPSLFTGTNITPLKCVQDWLDICYNSTLDLNAIYSQKNVTSNTIHKFQERNEYLTFQCFHHHLVFMLEKVLTKNSKKIFNNLQTFESVLQFLNENYFITPKIFSLDKFKLYDRLPLSYIGRNSKYLELKPEIIKMDTNYDIMYNSDLNDGKFFNSKKDADDDNNSCISSLFIDD